MKLRKGDLFKAFFNYDVVLITTNSTIKNDGSLVMGRGAALEIKNRWPGMPRIFGQAIQSREYNIVIPHRVTDENFRPGPWLGAFQVKYHWAEDASLDLIARSVFKLKEIAQIFPAMK